MKLLFKKDKEKIDIFIEKNSKEEIFSYVNMINYLINGEKCEETKFSGDFSEEEKAKVNDIIDEISKTVLDEKISDLEDEEYHESNFNIEEPEIDVKDIPF